MKKQIYYQTIPVSEGFRRIYSNKVHTAKLLLLIFLLLAVSVLQAQVLEVTSPNGGEDWLRETSQTITWNNYGDPADIAIEYSTDAGNTWYYLVYIPASDVSGEYNFINYMYPSDSVLVRVSYYNDVSVNDVSDAVFTVRNPPVTIYDPWYGASYYQTAPISISWYSETITSFNLEFSSDGGNNWQSIANNITETAYTWTAPEVLSDDCIIKISDANNPDEYGISNSFSIIETPVVELVSPNGGETWNYGEINEVVYSGSNLPYYMYAELSTDGGQSWEYLGYVYGADTGGVSTVYIPNVSTTEARIKISDPAFYAIADSSDANFTIYTPPVIIYYPQQEDEFINNTQTSFSWLATDMESVNIELSTDNGSSWTIIEENYNISGYYFWTVSGEPSDNCVIKISDADDPSRFGLSGEFTILPTPVVTLNSPQQSEIWNTNTDYEISWYYDNPNFYYLYLEYSSNGGDTWNYIGYVSNESQNGTYTWTTPTMESDEYLIRITDNSLDFVGDTSGMFSIRSYPDTPICIVSVDENSNNNIVTWEKPASALIDRFVIYREGESANNYIEIGEVHYDSLSTFVDTNSNPAVNSFRYKLGFKDAAGNIYPKGNFHQTIHLSINQGVGNSWNLIWNPYIGFDVSTYYVFRSTDNINFTQIATLSSSFNSYTDFDAPEGDVYYVVEVINETGCNPLLKASGGSVSRSNIVTGKATSVIENSAIAAAEIYPLPADERLSIKLHNSFRNLSINMVNLMGASIYKEELADFNGGTLHISTANIPDGIYMLRLDDGVDLYSVKLIIKH